MSKKRRKIPKSLKAKVALEACKGIHTLSELASKYNIHPNQISKWRKQLEANAPNLFERGSKAAENEEEDAARLYEEIGRLKMEIDWLKKKLQI
jgi:putative transposase